MSENLSLYELGQEELRLIEALEDGGGELTPELEAAWNDLATAKEVKLDRCHHIFTILKGKAETAKAEKDRLTRFIKTCENGQKRIKECLLAFMQTIGVNKIESSCCTCSIRNNAESVSCVDEEVIAPYESAIAELQERLPDYIRIKAEVSKTALADAIRAGEPVKAELVRNQSVSIR
ncbi:MAG: siphovirus Gp157 family protein [Clostridia bacterium]|nr:siphovirus Gp157 family protein [Clostridia bacterium]